jgi:hypothetical protein
MKWRCSERVFELVNHLQDMNEILMLDLGGAAFRSPPASPPDGGPTRFSFSSDQDLPPRPPHTEPLSPAWRVAEVGVTFLPP